MGGLTKTSFTKGDPRAGEAGKKRKHLIATNKRAEIYDTIDKYLDEFLPMIPDLINKLYKQSPDKALQYIISLLEFRLPRLARVEADINNNQQINIIVNALKEKKIIELKSEIEQIEQAETTVNE